jgi:hypothetical protein
MTFSRPLSVRWVYCWREVILIKHRMKWAKRYAGASDFPSGESMAVSRLV